MLKIKLGGSQSKTKLPQIDTDTACKLLLIRRSPVPQNFGDSEILIIAKSCCLEMLHNSLPGSDFQKGVVVF